MTRTMLLTAVVAIAAITSSNASAEEKPSSQGQISADLLAQLGLGDTAAVSDEEGLDIRGKGKKKTIVRYRVEVKKLNNGKLRRVSRATTKKDSVKLKRQKKGANSVRYSAKTTSKKSTPSRSGPSHSANRFNVR